MKESSLKFLFAHLSKPIIFVDISKLLDEDNRKVICMIYLCIIDEDDPKEVFFDMFEHDDAILEFLELYTNCQILVKRGPMII